MRLAEGKNPDILRDSGRRCVLVPNSVERGRIVFAVGALAGGLFLCAPAWAQSTHTLSSEIKARIERTFALVLGNSADLAIPLTRRALARRSVEDNVDDAPSVGALAYQDPSSADSSPDTSPAAGDEAMSPPTLEASAEAGDVEVARLPRPRPPAPGEEDAGANPMGGPLDLVAGAPVDETAAPEPEVVASASPRPLLEAHPSSATPDDAAPGPELVASGPCLAIGDVADEDGDFKRNRDALSAAGICINEEKFEERGRKWTIATVKTNRPGPLWAVMHDDEDLSFDTAVAELKTYGGTLVAVETGGKRNLSGIDPNRNFSADGVGCTKLGDNAAPHYTAFFRSLFDPSEPIIALHNNTGKRIPTGGLGHVSMDDVPKDMVAYPSKAADSSLAGHHDLVLLTSIIPVTTTSKARAADLAAKGINAVIETVRKDKGDCSLSNYAILTGNADYLNVTVDHDEGDKQKQIIDTIMLGHTEEVATQ